MANEAQGSAVVDPLVNYWGLSLFPQTSGVLPDASKPYNADLDLVTIHNHLRSMALRSPGKFMEQAKSIIDDNPGLFNSEALGDSASYEINDVVCEEAKENPRERRPALGHKRARFSMKPNKIHPTEILKPSLDIDDLKDPAEFFMAHERLENAKREIQKQMGNVLLEPKQNNTSTNARQRRPGLLRNNQRRSVKYKYRFSIETSGNKENVPFSQETFDSGGLDPVGENQEKAEACLASPRIELAESSAMQENNLNNILDELLHSSEDLQEDQAITLLQESLQIKPIVLEKLSIPDLPDNRVTELKTFGGNLSKPRKPLMNIDNLLKDMNNVTPVKTRQDIGNPLQELASPTPPKSPFALLPSLQKRISQSKPSVDPFSALDCDNLSTRNSSQTDMTKQGLNLVGSGKPSDKLNEPLVQDIKSSVEDNVRNFVATSGKLREDKSREPAFGANIDSNVSHVGIEMDTGERTVSNKVIDDIESRPSSEANEPSKFKEDTVRICASASGNSKEDSCTEPTNVDSNKSHVDMELDVGGSDVGNGILDDSRENYEANEPCKFKEDIVRTCANTSRNSKEDNSEEPAFGTNVDSNISHVDMEVDVGGSDVGNRIVDTIRRANEPNEFVDKVQEVVASEQTEDSDLNLMNPLEQSSHAWFKGNSVDGNTRASDDGPEQCLEMQVQENTGDSQVPVNERTKAKPRKRKGKGLSRRQSLAVAGTSWKSGVRRSTRIRSRPLEYWKGERPVYGRIHESLATVIGVKYMSPGTADGKPTMKVKSYVAEKYKELVELASQY